MFYVRSRHGDTGCNVMFHNKNGAGYGTNLDNLHLFTKEQAQKHLDMDILSLPLLSAEVDRLSIRAVDMQYLKPEDNELCKDHFYVIQIDGDWNGNDIYFMSESGKTYNYDEAITCSYGKALEIAAKSSNRIMWSKPYLETIARRTFQVENIDTRKMITGAGIKYKKPRKARPTTGKTRGNCPTCGKLTWDYNPYENAYCGIWCQP